MSYAVEVPHDVRAFVAGLGLPASIELAFFERLSECLSQDDVIWFSESVAPVRFFTFKFSVPDPNKGISHQFFLWVNVWEKPGTRLVIQVEHRES